MRSGHRSAGDPVPREPTAGADGRVAPSNLFVEFPTEALERSIPDRFEAIVRRLPDRLAVKDRRHALTYDALNRAANRVAHAIRERHGGGEVPVVLLAEDHVPMIIAILGALKAGTFFVPLNPAHPEGRTARLLEDSGAGMIVTSQRSLPLAHHLAPHGTPILTMDWGDTQRSIENPGLFIPPGAISHVLYTSGSTGQPKGVIPTHRNALQNVRANTNGFHLCAEDRLTLFASCSVGQGIVNAFSALLNGATLCPFNIQEEGIAGLAEWLIGQEITVYISAVTIFRHFADTLTGRETFPRLRLINLRSEPVRRSDVDRYKRHFPSPCLLANALSAVETGNVAQYILDHTTPIAEGTVPIGYAVPDTEILLLDEAGSPVAAHDVGEIAIESRYLALGYWRRPDLTRAAFRPGPSGGDARIYRTGDLGRISPDGCLLHLGRKDSILRVRGLAADLAEVEATLLDGGVIQEAVVVLREDRPGDPYLVAYCVPRRHPAPTVTALRGGLAQILPLHMIPSIFVILEALPRTPTGKVDRQALPAPGRSRPDLEAAFVAARTPVEDALAGVWAEVLGLDRVGIHDQFLELGGHSLRAMQILARVIATFGVELPLRELLETPTVAAMAARIVQRQAEAAGDANVARMLAELDGLSDEEATRRLTDETASSQDRRGCGRHDG